MTVNRFDVALGCTDNSLGFFKKIKKAVKKVGRTVEKAVKKSIEPIRDAKSEIASKVLPSSVRDFGRDMDRKGINKLAAGVALTIVTGGAGAGYLAAAAGAVGAKMATDSAVRDRADYDLKKAEDEALKLIASDEADAVAEIARAVTELPEFKNVVDELRSQGYTDPEIAAHWIESKSFYIQAMETSRAVIEPVVALEAVAAGVPDDQIDNVVYSVTNSAAQSGIAEAKKEVAAAAGNDVEKKSGGWVVPVGMLALLALV